MMTRIIFIILSNFIYFNAVALEMYIIVLILEINKLSLSVQL